MIKFLADLYFIFYEFCFMLGAIRLYGMIFSVSPNNLHDFLYASISTAFVFAILMLTSKPVAEETK